MNRPMQWGLALFMLTLSSMALAESTAINVPGVKTLKIERGLSEEGRACITCHQQVTPGQVADWKDSRHAHAGISCIDCHQVAEGEPHATRHANVEDTPVFVSSLVSPKVCGRCHVDAKAQFDASGHFRAYRQIIPKDSLHALQQNIDIRLLLLRHQIDLDVSSEFLRRATLAF